MRWRIPNSKPWITHDDTCAVNDVLDRIRCGDFELGSEVAAFERELAEFLGRKYVVCVSSGTVTLELAYRACTRSSINLPAFGFVATWNAAERACKEILPLRDMQGAWGGVHLLGEVDHGVTEGVTDACQAFGAKLPPSLADCYSGNWNKPVTCLGGGWVATDDAMLDSKIRVLRDQGRVPMKGEPLQAYMLGTNGRMSDMHAALGRSQLRRVGEILARRRERAMWYYDHVPVPACEAAPASDSRDSWFLYPIELSNRDEVHARMLAKGIQTRSCADWLLPAHPYYAEKYGYKRGMFPEAERRADRTLLLPLFPEMTLEQVQEVCRALEECDARA